MFNCYNFSFLNDSVEYMFNNSEAIIKALHPLVLKVVGRASYFRAFDKKKTFYLLNLETEI